MTERKIILVMHVSLDGFVAGPNGEMDWIHVDDELFAFVGKISEGADVGLYGRKTYDMMESYWPTADENPNATAHDIQHAQWYRHVTKTVVSKSMSGEKRPKTEILSDNIPEEVAQIKQGQGKNILLLGSPSIVHILAEKGLIDDYWLFVNPVAINVGIPLFKQTKRIHLNLVESKHYPSGVIGMHYKKKYARQESHAL